MIVWHWRGRARADTASAYIDHLREDTLAVSVPMELAGLEPATSWVRFRSATSANPLQKRVSARSAGVKPLGYPALTQGFWG
jgi:hypothetical protein